MEFTKAEDLARLVQPDRVHHSVYTDPAIFELEMDRLFGRAWLLLGHESQVRNAGDFFTTRLGREPVIVTRHADASLQVLINRCTHRGSLLCHEAKGSSKQFTCPYHGWTFETNGALRAVPVAQGYGADAQSKFAALGLARVPRVESYRGFIFASLAASGPSLAEFLGPLHRSFDDMVDRAPDGELELAGGVFFRDEGDCIVAVFSDYFSRGATYKSIREFCKKVSDRYYGVDRQYFTGHGAVLNSMWK